MRKYLLALLLSLLFMEIAAQCVTINGITYSNVNKGNPNLHLEYAYVKSANKSIIEANILPEVEIDGKIFPVTEISGESYSNFAKGPFDKYYYGAVGIAWNREAGRSIYLSSSSRTDSVFIAFRGCSKLRKLSIPASITSVGVCAFELCENLQEVVIEDSDNPIEFCAGSFQVYGDRSGNIGSIKFFGPFSGTEINILNSVEKHKGNGRNMKRMYVGREIKVSIPSFGNPYEEADHFLSYSSNLEEIEFGENTNMIHSHMFSNVSSNVNIKFPQNTQLKVDSYALNVKSDSIFVPGNVVLAENAFRILSYSGGFMTSHIQSLYLFTPYNYEDPLPADKVYTFTSFYDNKKGNKSNAVYLDFLQPEHITPLKTGVKIDYSSRLKDFDIAGYEIKKLQIVGTELDNEPNDEMDYDIIDVPLRNDGKYVIPIQNIHGNVYGDGYSVSMTYFDPRVQRDVTTQFYGYHTSNNLIAIKDVETTHSTATVDVEFLSDESYEISSATFRADQREDVTIDHSGKVCFNDLYVDSSNGFTPEIVLKDGRKSYNAEVSIKTEEITFNEYTNVGATSISVDWKPEIGDAEGQIQTTQFDAYAAPFNGTPINQNTIVERTDTKFTICNLPLGSTIKITMSLGLAGDNIKHKKQQFELPPLKLETKPAKATSHDCAIIWAETNMSNEEIGGGFEWRRYDAPDMVPSTFVKCSVNNGEIAGKLKGLSANVYYKYRPYYEDCNGERTFGEWMAFGTADAYVYFEPMVHTYEPTAVTESSVTLSGYALGGSDDIIEQGFEYSVAATTDVFKVQVDGQRMTATLTDLLPGTTYIARAYVTDSKSTTRGETVAFTTAGEPQDAIEEVAAESENLQKFDIWTLQGVCVRRGASDLNGLRPGFYIANGRKIIVR